MPKLTPSSPWIMILGVIVIVVMCAPFGIMMESQTARVSVIYTSLDVVGCVALPITEVDGVSSSVLVCQNKNGAIVTQNSPALTPGQFTVTWEFDDGTYLKSASGWEWEYRNR